MKTISFVIPVYNEEKRLKKAFKALKNLKLPRGLKLNEVIFVNDGSTDKTVGILKKNIPSVFPISPISLISPKIISYSQNKGKGYAVKQGMLASKADYTLFFDADISTPLSEINKFMPYIKNDIDVIIGTRKNGESTVIKHQPFFREILGRGFTLITQKFLGLNVTDFTCGFKAFSKQAKEKIFSKSKINSWGYDAEIIFLAQKNNLTIAEKAVTWSNDEQTKVKLHKAIPQTLFDLIKILWKHEIKEKLIFNFKFKIFNEIQIFKN